MVSNLIHLVRIQNRNCSFSRLPSIARLVNRKPRYSNPSFTLSLKHTRVHQFLGSPRLYSSSVDSFFKMSTHALDVGASPEAPTTGRLTQLRQLMKEENINMYIIPSEDNHASEYIASCHARRQFISGFTGSAGYAIVTEDDAILSTDGRYFIQAERELDSNWTLLKQGAPKVPTVSTWLVERAKNKRIGVDPNLLSYSFAQSLQTRIKDEAPGGELVPVQRNLVDLIWTEDRPEVPSNPIVKLDLRYAGEEVDVKLAKIREKMSEKKSPAIIVSMLDEVAWLFNLRGSDIDYNPVFFSYAIITQNDANLYVDEFKLAEDVKQYLLSFSVNILPYDSFETDLRRIGENKDLEGKIIISSSQASWAIKLALGGDDRVNATLSPVNTAKGIKNKTELEGMRACHVRDGAAITKFLAWLDDQLVVHNAVLTEVDASEKLEEFRRLHDICKGPSFETISSTGANAALIHYSATPSNCSIIDKSAIYLCDSGGQYLDGTTDCTRTVHFGEPTYREIEAYTLVLKGVIALHTATFPKEATGQRLDSFARQALWKYGLDYCHSTGHGVGSYLNVHEGPMHISYRAGRDEPALAVGNVLSNEPGYYEEGNFGIRIEDMMIVQEVETKYKFNSEPFLGFERITLVPYCRKLIDIALLSPEEREWVNQKNLETYEKTYPLLSGDDVAVNWLKRETAPL